MASTFIVERRHQAVGPLIIAFKWRGHLDPLYAPVVVSKWLDRPADMTGRHLLWYLSSDFCIMKSDERGHIVAKRKELASPDPNGQRRYFCWS